MYSLNTHTQRKKKKQQKLRCNAVNETLFDDVTLVLYFKAKTAKSKIQM